MLILIDLEMQRLREPAGKMGRHVVFSNVANQLCLSIKVSYKSPLRQVAGMVRALLKLAGLDWPVPGYTILCRRQKILAVQIPGRRSDGPLNLLVDSTGTMFLVDVEWHACDHGPTRRRQWRRVHLAMDTATSEIRALEFTSRREGDSPTLSALLDRIPGDEQIDSVTAEGAYDTRCCHTAILNRNANPSSRSARTVGSGARTARPRSLATLSSATFAEEAAQRGSGETATMQEAGQRPR